MMPLKRLATLATLLCAVALPQSSQAQAQREIPTSLLRRVMPLADRFGERAGDPPVIRAYGQGSADTPTLVGYVFLTSDLPPEPFGYNGPVESLVGMDLDGQVTGVLVTDYWESIQQSLGDFLRRPGFQEQFRGKQIGDPFRVGGDVDGIARATISVRALARGVRDASRRVAQAYFEGAGVSATAPVEDRESLPWLEMRDRGIIEWFLAEDPTGSAEINLVHIDSDEFGTFLVGPERMARARQRMERRGTGHLIVYGVDGPRLRHFKREGWMIVQGQDTVPVPPDDIVSLGLDGGGMMEERVILVGSMIIDERIDVTRSFTILYDRDPEADVVEIEYLTQAARLALLEAEDAASRTAEEVPEEAEAAGRADPGGTVGEDEHGGPPAARAPPDAPTHEEGPAEEVPEERVEAQVAPTALAEPPERETVWAQTLSETSWTRAWSLVALLALATAAFFLKSVALRWVTLAATLAYLGFVDGGFLSVSHIASGIRVGATVYVSDLPLLLIVGFTVIATLVWGRVFCGFLCPFGAVQDFLDRAVPDRLQWRIPPGVHRSGLWIKYVLLAVVLVPALLGSRVSLYQYFEPFGTVFFMSPSVVLWSIAATFLLASAIVPRFYCRYVCPLGAALALGSLLSLRHIRRVEHCHYCKVCEEKCPTGAIKGGRIDFKECVRCNLCEIKLIERAGVCAHDLESVLPRLVPLTLGGSARRPASSP